MNSPYLKCCSVSASFLLCEIFELTIRQAYSLVCSHSKHWEETQFYCYSFVPSYQNNPLHAWLPVSEESWLAYCYPSPCLIASIQDCWLALSGSPEQMLSHLPLCVLGCADDIPWHCPGNTFHTLRTPLCFPNSLTKNKKMLYTSSCQLLPLASGNNLIGRLWKGLIKQKVALLVSVSHPETTLKVSPISGIALYTTVYRGSAFKKHK